jgi:hypothetical protein
MARRWTAFSMPAVISVRRSKSSPKLSGAGHTYGWPSDSERGCCRSGRRDEGSPRRWTYTNGHNRVLAPP